MRHWNRALMTLVAAAAAGFLLWFSPHFNRWTTGGYWGVIALMVVAGVLIGSAQLHGRDRNSTSSFLVVILPVLVASGWVILAVQPQGNFVRDHILSWSGDMGINHAVHNLGERVAVVAFGFGVIFGLTFEPKMVHRRSKTGVTSTAAVVPSSPPLTTDHAVEEPAEETPTQQAESGEQGPDAPPD